MKDLNAKKKAASILYTKEARVNLFTSLAERFKERPGGYTRIIKLGTRMSDSASMCRLELVDYLENEGKAKREKRAAHLEKREKAREKQEEQERSAPMMAR